MKLREFRIKNNLQQQEVAKFINKTKSGYGYYESGRTEPDIKTLCKLADLYHITLDELVGREQKNIIDKGLLSQTELDIIEIMKNLNTNYLEKLEAYAAALYSTQKDQETIIRKIKGNQ